MPSPQLRKIIQQAFPDMADNEADNLITIGQVHSYPPRMVLCREGEVEAVFYIILEGEVEVNKTINASEARMLKPLRPGDFFGEYALIHEAPRSATVTTILPTTVLEITKSAFDRMLRNSTSVSVAMVREVSRRLRENDEMAIEDLRVKARELAVAYQQLAELDFARREFLTTIAHELRTPLTASSGFLQVIQMGMLEGEALTSALDTVARNIQQIVLLINDILFLQEMDLILGEAQPLDLGTVITSAVEKQRARAQNGQVGLQFSLAPALPSISGDPDSLERAFSAIFDNSIKFSPQGGQVEIAAFEEGGQVTVRVQDHGVGIPEYALPRIFDRFYRLEQVGGYMFGGVGLGLSIAHKVIEQHGGSIEVQSALGEGTIFSIRLPASA